ncbi:hypothetical protein F4824DRAFT_96865 [Ustulina deusta]|nr:hypothetical protein F4824DRAFT_96865 [Ustulina deusta]
MKRIYNPFRQLKREDYLQRRPDTDVYKLLIDAHRRRIKNNDICASVHHEDGIHSKAKDGLEGFCGFCHRAKAIPGTMPCWWSDNKQLECEEPGRQKGRSSLADKIFDIDVRQHYKEKFIDIQLS